MQTSNKNFILKYFRCRDGKRTETRIGMEGICITHSCIPLYTVYLHHNNYLTVVECRNENGEIILYVINVTVLETGEQLQWNATNTMLEVTGLKPFRTYACRLAASTSVGLGPFGPEVAFQTLEDEL